MEFFKHTGSSSVSKFHWLWIELEWIQTSCVLKIKWITFANTFTHRYGKLLIGLKMKVVWLISLLLCHCNFMTENALSHFILFYFLKLNVSIFPHKNGDAVITNLEFWYVIPKHTYSACKFVTWTWAWKLYSLFFSVYWASLIHNI